MSGGNHSDSLNRKQHSSASDMNTVENLLEHLLSTGYLELPISGAGTEELEDLQPSRKARETGKRVREKVLTRLGIPNIGSLIARERELRGIKQIELARKAKLAREILTEIETNRLEFSELTPKKAVDLVQVLGLNPKVVLQYLVSTSLADMSQRTPAPLFRIDRDIDEVKREELEQKAQEELAMTGQDKKNKIEQFVQEFVQEASKRGLLKD